MPQSAAHPVASDCRSASSADDKAHSCRRTRGFCIGGSRGVVRSRQVHDDRAAAGPSPTPCRHPKVTSQAQTVRRGQHGSVLRVRLARRRGDDGDRSGGKPLAALTPTVAQDGAPSTGTHPQAESVGLVPTAIVRLEGALTHGFAPGSQAQKVEDGSTTNSDVQLVVYGRTSRCRWPDRTTVREGVREGQTTRPLESQPCACSSRPAVDNCLLVPSRRCYGHPTQMVVVQPKLSPYVILSAL